MLIIGSCTKSKQEKVFRGYFVYGHEVQSFAQCGDKKTSYWIGNNDIEAFKLQKIYDSLSLLVPYSPIYIELKGTIDSTLESTRLAQHYNGILKIKKIEKAESLSSKNDCDDMLESYYDKTLEMSGVSCRVSSTKQGGDKQHISIKLIDKKGNSSIWTDTIDGYITDAEMADLNRDNSPEIYCFVTTPGSGSYGSIFALSSESMSYIYLVPEIPEVKGYMGHDLFQIENNYLTREFPIYRENDTNANPTGGKKKIKYKLIQGEASWLLVPER